MDKKRTVISMLLLVAFMLTWNMGWDWLAKKYNWKTSSNQQAAQTTPAPTPAPVTPTTSPTTLTSPTSPTTAATTGPTTGTTMVATSHPAGPLGGLRSVVMIGSMEYDPDGNKSEYPVGVKLTSEGAGIEAVYLNRYKRLVSTQDPYVFQKPYGVGSEFSTPLATRSFSVNGGPAIAMAAHDWKLLSPTTSPSTQTSAVFATDVLDAAGNKIAVTKTYTVHSNKEKDQGQGYEVEITYSFTNPGAQPVKLKTAFNGPTAPLAENTRDVTNLVSGFDADGAVAFKFEPSTSLKANALDIRSLNKNPVIWAGFSSNYFNAIVRLVDATGKPLLISDAKGWALKPDEKDPGLRDPVVALESPEITVPANGSASFGLRVFVGPKLRAVLNNPYYSSFPANYDTTLVMSSGICAICTWDFLINSLVWLLNFLHVIFFKDWGLAIIGLVVIVRLLLHPVTKRSQISMSRMTKMGPEMEKLKKKYSEDKEGLQKAQMQLYKEQGIAPVLGCLPMFLQMPIWIALWSALQSTFEIRHAPFLWGYTWIKDLAQPDALITLKEPVGIWFLSISALNLLPILMGVIFWLQQKFSPQPAAMSPEQEQQQKMMKWMMPFMMPIFLYTSPSGLNLYILTSTAIGIWESKRVRDHIKERDEKEKAGLVVIDVPFDGKDPGGAAVLRGKPPEPKKPGFLSGLMERAQKMAEEAQKNAKAQQGTGKKKK